MRGKPRQCAREEAEGKGCEAGLEGGSGQWEQVIRKVGVDEELDGWEMGFGIGDWDQGCGSGIEIGDWDWGQGIGMGDWDWGLGSGIGIGD